MTAEDPPLGGPTPARGWVGRVFSTRQFFALFNVQVISALGDWVGFFAITSLAASISSQPEGAIALVTLARVAPGFFLAPFIGVIVDRFDRKRLMITADIVRAGVYLLLPLVRTVPGLILASFVLEVFTMMWSPAKEATVPAVVPEEKLAQANSLGLVAAYATLPIAGPIQFALKTLNDRLVQVSFLGFLGLNRSLGDTQTLAFYFDALTFMTSAVIISRFVFRGLPSNARRKLKPVAEVDSDDDVREVAEMAMEREKSHLRSVWADIREGLDFIFVNPVVRAVNIGLATGLVGGAMLIPLGPTFARFVIGDADTFPLFITAMGVGVASGVVLVSAIQNRLPKETVFPFCVMGAGISLFLGVSMSSFWLAALGVAGLGLFAGATYVLGFTLLQSHTDADLRGRIFTTLLTLVRLCVMLALLMGPVLATIFNGFARAATGDPEPEVPTWSFFGFDLAIPGVRITLWLASAIIFGAGVLAARSMKLGIRSSLKEGWADVTGELRFRNSGGEVALEEPGDETPGEEAS
jgi:dTMP kinase